VTLPAFAAERRCLLHGAPAAGTRLSIDISCLQGAQQQTRRTPLLLSIEQTDGPSDGHADRRTDRGSTTSPCSNTVRAASVMSTKLTVMWHINYFDISNNVFSHKTDCAVPSVICIIRDGERVREVVEVSPHGAQENWE